MSAAQKLLARMDATTQRRGAPMARNELLGHVAALRGDVPPHELSTVAMVVQGTYFTYGAEGHLPEGTDVPDRSCTLFPGRFARLLRHHAARLPSLELPPYDRGATPAAVRARMQRIGLDLDAITSLSPQGLFDVTRSPEWTRMRTLLRLDDVPPAL